MARAVKNSTLLKDQTGREDLARDDGSWVNLNATFSVNHSIKPAKNGDLFTVNLTFDPGVLAENQCVI